MQGEREKKVIIAAGGTGGHVFPGIAVAEEMKRLNPGLEITFAGTARGLESKILPKLGWPLMLMGSSSIKDKGALGKVLAYARIPFSVIGAIATLAADRPSLVVSIGGYAAAPLVFASWLLRVPVVMVEPNSIPGMTNRKLGKLAKRVFVAFEEAKPYFANGKAQLTGVPIRSEILEAKRSEGSGKRTLFVFGGSQGALTLNRAMSAAAGKLGDMKGDVRIIHQTGGGTDPADVKSIYDECGIESDVTDFCERIWEYYGMADLVIARSGANTVAELSALGLPSILVPYPYAADDHQRANAMALVKAGGARMIDDSECDGERIAREIADVIGESSRLEAMAVGAKSVGHPDAAKTIARECMDIMKTDR